MGQLLCASKKLYPVETMNEITQLKHEADDCIKCVKSFEKRLVKVLKLLSVSKGEERKYLEDTLFQTLMGDGEPILKLCKDLRTKVKQIQGYNDGAYRKSSIPQFQNQNVENSNNPQKNKMEHEATEKKQEKPSESGCQQQSDGQQTVINVTVEEHEENVQHEINDDKNGRHQDLKNANFQVSDSDNDNVDEETLQKKEPHGEDINTSKQRSEADKNDPINYLTSELDETKELRETEKEPRETKTKRELRQTKKELKETKKQLEETKKVLKETKIELRETKKELASLQQRNDSGKGKSKSKKIGYVQILDKGSGSLGKDVGKDAVKELITMLCGTLNTETFQLEVMHCSEPSRVNYEIPLLVICFDSSRIGTDVLKAIDGIHDFEKTMVLIFHHTKQKVNPTKQDLKDPKLLNLKGRIHDFAFYEGEGVYVSTTNDTSKANVVGFIRDYYHENIVTI